MLFKEAAIERNLDDQDRKTWNTIFLGDAIGKINNWFEGIDHIPYNHIEEECEKALAAISESQQNRSFILFEMVGLSPEMPAVERLQISAESGQDGTILFRLGITITISKQAANESFRPDALLESGFNEWLAPDTGDMQIEDIAPNQILLRPLTVAPGSEDHQITVIVPSRMEQEAEDLVLQRRLKNRIAKKK